MTINPPTPAVSATPVPSLSASTPGVKPGVLTTEFWLQNVAQVVLFLNTSGAWVYVHPQWASLVVQGTVLGLYTLSRGWVKAGAAKRA